jgi:hypothetical protein
MDRQYGPGKVVAAVKRQPLGRNTYMSRVRHPKEKKRLSLARDHRSLIADSNSRERAYAIRTIKRKGKRAVRRKASAILQTGLKNPDTVQDDFVTKVPTKARAIRKNAAVTLGQYLDPKIKGTRHNLRSISPLRKRNRR